MATLLADVCAPVRVMIRCWGDFGIVDGETGADLRPRGRKARAILAYLALHLDKAVSRERLMALLWGDRADEQARASLRQSLFELRALGNGAGVLLITRDTATMRGDAVTTDIALLEQAARDADYQSLQSRLPDADACLFANLDGLSEGFDEWLQIERMRQRDDLAAIVTDAAADAAVNGKARAARALDFWAGQPARTAVSNDPAHAAPSVDARLLVASPAPRRASGPIRIGAGLAAALAVAAAGYALIPKSDRPAVEGPRIIEARMLHRDASALIMERRAVKTGIAVEMLKRAVVLDPNHAPAWASLAAATAMGHIQVGNVAEAERYARRALSIDPNNAQAHGALGMILGFSTPEAGRHLFRAVALAPRDIQNQFWLSNHHSARLEFGQRLRRLRTVVALDPYWGLGVTQAAVLTSQMGNGSEADAWVRKLSSTHPAEARACHLELEMERAALANLVRDLRAINDLEGQYSRDLAIGRVLLMLGHKEQARTLLRLPAYQWAIASGAPISEQTFTRVATNASSNLFDSHFLLNQALERLLRDNRPEKIVALYDRAGSGVLLDLKNGGADRATLVHFGPHVAVALRLTGRQAEAGTLSTRIDRIVREARAAGPVPNWFDARVAIFAAYQGRREEALSALERAVARGWHYQPMSALPDIADIHAFHGLRGDPRFEHVRARLVAHLHEERRKLGSEPI